MLVERISSTPETVLMASSIGFVTDVSISSALAPGKVVVTEHTGKVDLGKQVDAQRK